MVSMPRCRAILEGNLMKTQFLRSVAVFCAGVVAATAALTVLPQRQAQAPVANGNDKFSMITVPLQETGVPEGVFVLNNLTGMLVGGAINESTSKFANRYVHNVAADFQTGNTPDPRYAIVTGPANLRSSGGVQPAFGIIYVAELSSGRVIAYGFPRPTNRNVGSTNPLVILDFFQFAEGVGQ
ncbi:MAG: hypothetical protein ACKO3T_15400 [Planctomycetaceae bacterium]|jgi:hypothetical protein